MPTELFRDAEGGWRYRIRANNGEILSTSESYTRKHDAERAIDALGRAVDWEQRST